MQSRSLTSESTNEADGSELRYQISYELEVSNNWTWSGIGVICLLVLQLAFMQSPWTRTLDRNEEKWTNGWESLSGDVPGHLWLMGSIAVLLVSIFATFRAVHLRSDGLLRTVAALSVLRFGMVWGANAAALGGTPRRSHEYGVTLTFVTIAAVAVAAGTAAIQLGARAPSPLWLRRPRPR